MVIEIDSVPVDPRKMTQAVLQITSMLDLYQAELARILGINCGDIGQLANGRQCLQPGTYAWTCAELLVRCYRLLFKRMDGNGVAMRHWLRVCDRQLESVPHLLMVDEGRLHEVVIRLEPDTG